MYTSKSFYELVPEKFLSNDELLFKQAMTERFKQLDIINSVDDSLLMNSGGFVPRMRKQRETLSDKECLSIKMVSNYLRSSYIKSLNLKNLKTTKDVLNTIFSETSVIYGWYKDVDSFKLDDENKKFEKYINYKNNYWYFMEWQSDLYIITIAIYLLGDSKLPKSLSISVNELFLNYSILCGGNLISSRDDLLDLLYANFDTAYAWAYVESENDWINKNMPNSNDKTFALHVNFWASLIEFVENKIPHNNKNKLENLVNLQKIIKDNY